MNIASYVISYRMQFEMRQCGVLQGVQVGEARGGGDAQQAAH